MSVYAREFGRSCRGRKEPGLTPWVPLVRAEQSAVKPNVKVASSVVNFDVNETTEHAALRLTF